MLKLRHTTLIVISGLAWMGIGTFLMTLGLGLLLKGTGLESSTGNYPLIEAVAYYLGGREQAVLLLLVLCLAVGYFKGKFVLGKSAHRGMKRIRSFPNPTSLANIYSGTYYLLIAFMIGLGMAIKYLGLPHDVRGVVDLAVGSALINGAMIYFRHARSAQRPTEV